MKLDAFDEGGRQVLVQARHAAREAHHSRIGSGHLLRACLDADGPSRVLTRHGLDAGAVRRALPGAAPDRELLAAIGIDIDPDEVRERVRRSLGLEPSPPRLYRRRSRPLHIVFAGEGGRLLFSPGARKVLEVALWRSRGSCKPDWRVRQRRPATALDLLAGILADGRNPMCCLLVEHGLRIRPQFLAEMFPTAT